MKEKEYLYKLMHSVLIQIRAEAYERNDKKSFRLCDLLHNVPLKLLTIEQDNGYIKIYQELVRYAKSNGMEPWLDSEIKEIEKS
ncbi:hypothetical protein GWK08_07670 [Leptobacterium flavescens]|uniref:Uncharacterized protein n=1 Tax=Leptobacterium flavescens TaxID=472055 RepID=A0A6P0UIW4_9FLAO|nr:hypothetical protein [Leptobacterium flavescens]NER13311.1 hypothetical protein [Leptobacterium flavescens]